MIAESFFGDGLDTNGYDKIQCTPEVIIEYMKSFTIHERVKVVSNSKVQKAKFEDKFESQNEKIRKLEKELAKKQTAESFQEDLL